MALLCVSLVPQCGSATSDGYRCVAKAGNAISLYLMKRGWPLQVHRTGFILRNVAHNGKDKKMRRMAMHTSGKKGFEVAKPAVSHTGVKCDECGQLPITGPRFKCG